MRYEVIIFDADQTLFDFKKSEKVAFMNTRYDFNLEYDEEHHLKIYKEINTAIWDDFEKGKITQEKLKVERFRRLGERLKEEFNENEFAKRYMYNLSTASYLYEDSRELIEKLHLDRKLSIVTNGLSAVQNTRIRKSEIAHYFQDIVVSEEVNVAKPNPRILEIALENLKYTDKSRVLIVGDSLSSDIQGGINFGIDTCWYNPQKKKNETGIVPTYEISDLKELHEKI